MKLRKILLSLVIVAVVALTVAFGLNIMAGECGVPAVPYIGYPWH